MEHNARRALDNLPSAVADGVNTNEHCTWMTEGGEFGLREELLAEIKAHGI